VDEQDFVIVKSMGKWVTETGDVTPLIFHSPFLETYRQHVGKNLWFPAYSRSDETFQSGDVSVPIRIIIKWTDFVPAGKRPLLGFAGDEHAARSPVKSIVKIASALTPIIHDEKRRAGYNLTSPFRSIATPCTFVRNPAWSISRYASMRARFTPATNVFVPTR